MIEIWGPALDAQVAFHHEELQRAAGRRPKRARRSRTNQAQRTATASGRHVRGWLLRGSGAWHAAR